MILRDSVYFFFVVLLAEFFLVENLGTTHAETFNKENYFISEQEIPHRVRENNLHTKGAYKYSSAIEVERGYLERSYLPKVSVNLNHESYKTGTQVSRNESLASIDTVINLYNGGKDTLEDKIKTAEADSSKYQAQSVFREELRKSYTAYWNLVALREMSHTIKDAIHENSKNLSSAKERISAGLATDIDKYEFEIFHVELEQDLALVDLKSRNSERELAILLGFSPDVYLKTTTAVSHVHEDNILSDKVNLSDNPEIKVLDLELDKTLKEAELSRQYWLPSFDIYSSYGMLAYREREYEPLSERAEAVFGAKLTFNIFDGLVSSTDSEKNVLKAEGLRDTISQTLNELTVGVENAKSELKLKHELIHRSEETLKKIDAYYNATLDEYKRGVKNSPDVLSAMEKKLSMELKFIELRRDYQIARAEVVVVTGGG